MGIGPEEKGWGRRRAELTHRHVGARSNKGVGHGIYELAAHAKVAQLDLTARVDQNVGGLDIYMAEGTNKQMYIRSLVRHIFILYLICQLYSTPYYLYLPYHQDESTMTMSIVCIYVFHVRR